MQTIPLTLAVPGYDVPAALTLPEGPVAGAALIVPGSLFSDVDGNYPSWNTFPRVYAHLAEALAGRGVASLRFAKLGPGTGSIQTDAEQAATMRTWAGRALIARLALARMRQEFAERDMTPAHTILAGHSEGSVVVSVLANEGVDVDGVALLSGPSVGILGIMIEQQANMPGATDEGLAVLKEVIDYVRRDLPVPDSLRDRTTSSMGAGALMKFPPEALQYMREVDATDPVATIAGYEGPVLIVQGGADSNVPPHHGEALRDGRGHRPTRYICIPELTHMYKIVPAGTPPEQVFGWPGPIDSRVGESIVEFLQSVGSS